MLAAWARRLFSPTMKRSKVYRTLSPGTGSAGAGGLAVRALSSWYGVRGAGSSTCATEISGGERTWAANSMETRSSTGAPTIDRAISCTVSPYLSSSHSAWKRLGAVTWRIPSDQETASALASQVRKVCSGRPRLACPSMRSQSSVAPSSMPSRCSTGAPTIRAHTPEVKRLPERHQLPPGRSSSRLWTPVLTVAVDR